MKEKNGMTKNYIFSKKYIILSFISRFLSLLLQRNEKAHRVHHEPYIGRGQQS